MTTDAHLAEARRRWVDDQQHDDARPHHQDRDSQRRSITESTPATGRPSLPRLVDAIWWRVDDLIDAYKRLRYEARQAFDVHTEQIHGIADDVVNMDLRTYALGMRTEWTDDRLDDLVHILEATGILDAQQASKLVTLQPDDPDDEDDGTTMADHWRRIGMSDFLHDYPTLVGDALEAARRRKEREAAA